MRVGCDDEGVQKAAGVIGDGGIAIFPTDTVYGIGCNPYLKGSVDRIYRAKSRDASKPLPLLVRSVEEAEEIASLDGTTRKIVERFWPGALTVIVGITDERLRESLMLRDKVAVRMPDSGCALRILRETGCLVGTSANISGGEPFVDPARCPPELKGYEVFVDGGVIAKSRGESTIIESVDGKIKVHRQGAISAEEVTGV